MEQNDILLEMGKICREVFNEPGLEITAATTAKDVAGWDSMTNLFLIDAIERRFGFKFKLEEILNAQNVGELCAIVQERGLAQ